MGITARRRGDQRMARRVMEDGQRATAEDFAGPANPPTRHQDIAKDGLFVAIEIDRKRQQIAQPIGVPEPGRPLGGQQWGERGLERRDQASLVGSSEENQAASPGHRVLR